MLQQILKLSNNQMGKKDAQLPKPSPATKRKKRKESIDENTYIGIEEPTSKSRRIKITRVKKHNGKGHRKKSNKATVLNEVNLNHASPKIWDIFERFQTFAQRKVLTRHPSGLLESCDEEAAEGSAQLLNAQLDPGRNNVQRNVRKIHTQTLEPSPENDDDEYEGGDRKRRCLEISNYEDELRIDGKREPQPVSAFKPKCLNFDEIDS